MLIRNLFEYVAYISDTCTRRVMCKRWCFVGANMFLHDFMDSLSVSVGFLMLIFLF